MAETDKEIVVGLDIGTSGITVAAIEKGYGIKQGEPLIVGFSPCMGIDKGIIVEVEDVVDAIKRAVVEVENAIGRQITSVYTSVNIPGVVAVHGSAKQKAAGRRTVNHRDIKSVQQNLYSAVVPAGFTGVQQTGIKFYVDGKPVIKPVGCQGRELKVDATILIVPGEQMEQIQCCLGEAGLKVRQTVVGSVAVAGAVLTGVERELGVLCVDIGVGMTKVAYINHGLLKQVSIFPVGAGHITADLAVGLHTNLEMAEYIKIRSGLQQTASSIKVQSLSGVTQHTVTGDLVNRIIQSRVEETLEYIKQFINHLNLCETLLGGIVLTGGGALLGGLPAFAQSYWGMPVRKGYSRVILKNVSDNEAYRYTSAVGLALWITEQRLATSKVKRRITERGIVARLKSWLQ